MSSLSQAPLLGYLPSPHGAFQGHASHPIEWSMALRPKGSSGTCIPEGGLIHIPTLRFHGTRSAASAQQRVAALQSGQYSNTC